MICCVETQCHHSRRKCWGHTALRESRTCLGDTFHFQYLFQDKRWPTFGSWQASKQFGAKCWCHRALADQSPQEGSGCLVEHRGARLRVSSGLLPQFHQAEGWWIAPILWLLSTRRSSCWPEKCSWCGPQAFGRGSNGCQPWSSYYREFWEECQLGCRIREAGRCFSFSA